MKLNRRLVGFDSMLNDVVEIIKAKAASEQVTIREQYDFMPELTVDPELMKTCILNVVTNAFQAMPEGGTLSVHTGRENGRFILSVRDTGQGVSRENLSKIFEPFFTTKDTGLGLGLATTKRIIEEHGGRIDFQSSEGEGSSVIISLPLQ
jgi:signal transduction histidine kinase